ncbi:Mitotic checkpoint serine/threonine-protein kinase BUB1 [Merluccius polli]|uniref:Mitotic checkpoint serine/threonine-protein kinase BUB1 n=1 Tax=Merluccius polli TaxID=89951 RepID=A0AA47P8B9_MERPO|nr:Mitotic checkpoint serine/threonine-protein kinase BUB1 [Merluccius polli]
MLDVEVLGWSFENSLSSYCGDDPLDPWDRFVEYLGKRVASDDAAAMLFVLNRLVERFLHEERYANDVRYVNHCITCASYYAEPVSMYAYVYGKGVGTRAAPLYVAWAQQFEQSGAQEQAEAVYQRAVENQAQPSDAVLHEYRQFQMRTSKAQTVLPATGRLPLQTSQLVNQMPPHREPAVKCEGTADCATLAPGDRMQRIITDRNMAFHTSRPLDTRPKPEGTRRYPTGRVGISRSENLGVATRVPGQEASASVSVYQKDALQCEGSELSFEEVRAARYFLRVRQEEERREFEDQQRLMREKEGEVMKLKHHLETLNHELGGPRGTPAAAAAPGLPFAPPQVKHKPPAPLATAPPAAWRVFSDQGGSTTTTATQPPHLAHPAAPRAGPDVSQWAPARAASGGCLGQHGAQEREFPENEPTEPYGNAEEEPQRLVREKEEEFMKLKRHLETLNQDLGGPQGTPAALPQVQHKPPTPAAAAPPAGWRVFSDQGAALAQPQPQPPAQGAEEGVCAFEPLLAVRPAPRQSLAGSGGRLGEAVPPAPSARPGLPGFPRAQGSRLDLPDGQCQVDGGATGRGPIDPLLAGAQRQHGAQEREFPEDEPTEPRLDISQGATASFSHITPNTSLGLAQATPSRVLPSPTVNTREALGVIMDMFQAPTLLDDPFNNTSLGYAAAAANGCPDGDFMRNGKCCATLRMAVGTSSLANPAPTSATPFTIFQDHWDQENPRYDALPRVEQGTSCKPGFRGAAADVCAVEKPKAARALVDIHASSSSDRPSEGPQELTPDESTMWGVRYNSLHSLAACPNSSRDFALSAQVVSTPFTSKTPYFTDCTRQDRVKVGLSVDCVSENNCQSVLDDEENVFLRQPKKLSPIIEQSPSDETFSKKAGGPMRVRGPTECGTIVGEGLSLGPHSGLAASCTTVVHAPPGALSFRDHTLVQSARSPPRAPGSAAAAAAWSVFASPAPSPKPAPAPPPLSQEPEAWAEEPTSRTAAAATAGMALQRPASPGPVFDVPMSPECGLTPDWLVLRSPEVITEPDLDAFVTPPRPAGAASARGKNTDVSMTPDPPLRSFSDMCVSPAGRRITQSHVAAAEDEPMMSPDRGSYPCADVPMSPAVPKAAAAAAAAAAGGHLVSDPWNEELIAGLLSRLSPSLGSHPHCITWQCKLPNITPKTTITMGTASLRVDCLLGEGAFAKVYQATDPMSSEKMVVKVQKPANPWEFYINTQLDARLPPAVRHLYSKVQSAHLFHNGSILLAELHRCGTLLNAVNQYKKLSDRVMPQPLVMYFTVCMLHMVEQLHRVHLVHADIKPDNFLLGERFLESRCLDPEDMEHGMVLLDMGQSIDMELFPEGTAFTARCLTSGFQCTEMLSGRPWSYQFAGRPDADARVLPFQTDYFGLAGSVYCMLFGTYMQVKQEDGVWKTNAVFRRNPHSELWLQLFHTLLNIPDGDRLPCLRSLRRALSAALRETYGGGKLLSLKNRLVVLLLENLRDARR